MSKDVPEKPMDEVSGQGSEAVLPSSDVGETDLAGAPKVTFRGNTYDLLSLGALATGALMLRCSASGPSVALNQTSRAG